MDLEDIPWFGSVDIEGPGGRIIPRHIQLGKGHTILRDLFIVTVPAFKQDQIPRLGIFGRGDQGTERIMDIGISDCLQTGFLRWLDPLLGFT